MSVSGCLNLGEDLRYEAKLQKAKKASDLQRVILGEVGQYL